MNKMNILLKNIFYTVEYFCFGCVYFGLTVHIIKLKHILSPVD